MLTLTLIEKKIGSARNVSVSQAPSVNCYAIGERCNIIPATGSNKSKINCHNLLKDDGLFVVVYNIYRADI